MLVKLVCVLFVVLVADAASISGKCHVTNPLEPDLEKLSGSWYMVSYHQEAPGSLLIEFKKDGAGYTLTDTENKTITDFRPLETGVDEENRQLLRLGEQKNADFDTWYLMAAEYDKFVIVHVCDSKDIVHGTAFVLARSKVVDEDTRKKIKNVLQEYPGLEYLKNKFA